MESSGAAAPALKLRLRGGDGVVFQVEARWLAELAPGFAWDLPAVESIHVYRLIGQYLTTVRTLTDPATGQLSPEGADTVNAMFKDMAPDVVGHLARAAIHLKMKDLLALCHKKIHEMLLQLGHETVLQFLKNDKGNQCILLQ